MSVLEAKAVLPVYDCAEAFHTSSGSPAAPLGDRRADISTVHQGLLTGTLTFTVLRSAVEVNQSTCQLWWQPAIGPKDDIADWSGVGLLNSGEGSARERSRSKSPDIFRFIHYFSE
jgi:hypothetical protein